MFMVCARFKFHGNLSLLRRREGRERSSDDVTAAWNFSRALTAKKKTNAKLKLMIKNVNKKLMFSWLSFVLRAAPFDEVD